MLELIHAWAGSGDAAGFRTVRRSPGISDTAAAMLVARSGLDVATPPSDTIIAYRMLHMDGGPTAVLSRIVQTQGPSPARPGRLAHHLVLRSDERPEVGPATLLTAGRMADLWDDTLPPTSLTNCPQASCMLKLDPLWGDFVAQRVAARASTTLVAPRTMSVEAVVVAVSNALPESQRWDMTFIVSSHRMLDGVLLRVVHEGSLAADQLANAGDAMTLPVSDPPPPLDPTPHSAPAALDIPLRMEATERPHMALIVVCLLTLAALAGIGWVAGVLGP